MMGLIGGFAKAAGYLQDYSDDENDLASISVLSSLSSIMPDTPHIHVAVPSIPKSIDPETEVIITTKKYANGELYEGPMMDGMRHGDGAVSIRADGSKFSGSYLFDKPFQGTLITSSYTYIGRLKNNQFQDPGTLLFSDGTMYHGDFEDGLRHGVGKETSLASEEELEIIKHSKKTRGKSCDKTKARFVTYCGHFYLGKRHGLGTLLDTQNGACLYSGLFINGQKAQFRQDSPNQVLEEVEEEKKE